MRPRPTKEQFLPHAHAHAYDVRGCKGSWTCVSRHASERRGAVRRLRVNYRYYNPIDGRWMRRDPNGLKSGMNLYSYTDNSVSYKMDYLGLVGSPKVHKTKTLVENVIECKCGTKSTAKLSWWIRLQLIMDYGAIGFSLELSSEIPCDLSSTKDGPSGKKGGMKITYRFVLEWEEWEESREELIPNPVTGGFDRKIVTPTYREDMHIVPYMTMIEDTSYLCCKKYH